MPTDTWIVTASSQDSVVSDVTAIHYNREGVADSSFSSRLKNVADRDIDTFVALAKTKLAADLKVKDDADTLITAIQRKFNS